MLKRIQIAVLVSMSIWGFGSVAYAADTCPGQNGKQYPDNLACEIVVANRGNTSNLKGLPTTVASQLGQLPLASAVSGSGLTLNKSLGVFTASQDSLGTILTQRGETMGKHALMASFTYQHFGFGSIDGIGLKSVPTVVTWGSPTPTAYTQGTSNIDLSINQYTVLAAYGLTSKVDVALILPFSNVNLRTRSSLAYYANGALSSTQNYDFPGSATGIGDVTANVKASVFKGEKLKVAVGGEVRFPSGDAANYLGTGAYGFKPYIVLSGHGRLTPNVNIGYQWNGNSILNGGNNLPSSFLYSGGADYRVTSKFTLVGEFLGQCVINGPRLSSTTVTIPGAPSTRNNSLNLYNASYAMNNLGGGFKAQPFKHLVVNASVLFKLDDAGLRSKILPLAGASYRF